MCPLSVLSAVVCGRVASGRLRSALSPLRPLTKKLYFACGVWWRSRFVLLPLPNRSAPVLDLAFVLCLCAVGLPRPRLPVASVPYTRHLRSVVSLASLAFPRLPFPLFFARVPLAGLLVPSRKLPVVTALGFLFVLSVLGLPCAVLALVAPPSFPRAVPPDPLSRFKCVESVSPGCASRASRRGLVALGYSALIDSTKCRRP